MRLIALFAALVLALNSVVYADPTAIGTAPATTNEWPMQPCPRC